MKTLSAVSTKVSVLSGRPVIQVTNVTVYAVIVNPYRFIDPTSVFFLFFFILLLLAQPGRSRFMPARRRKCPTPSPSAPPPPTPSFIFSLKTQSLTPPIYVTAVLLLTAFALFRLASAAANLTAALLFHPCSTL